MSKWSVLRYQKEQIDLGKVRYSDLNVDLRFQDYRDVSETFDRIISIGMFEHVGPRNYRTYMKVVESCLVDDGLFLLHTIGTNTTRTAATPGPTSTSSRAACYRSQSRSKPPPAAF